MDLFQGLANLIISKDKIVFLRIKLVKFGFFCAISCQNQSFLYILLE